MGAAALVVAALLVWVVARMALRPFLSSSGARTPRDEADLIGRGAGGAGRRFPRHFREGEKSSMDKPRIAATPEGRDHVR